tara:strand:+ start:24 stop:176 length:153 start_codon:yes stop_codon:yes gene_type:complete
MSTIPPISFVVNLNQEELSNFTQLINESKLKLLLECVELELALFEDIVWP